MRTARWVDRELARGAKVYYTGSLPQGVQPHDHWIAGPDGAAGAGAAVASGQLELLDLPSVIETSGGTAGGLHRLLAAECERAMAEGWPTVAMSQESPRLPMSDDEECGYDTLVERWPLTILCQLTVEDENAAAVFASAAGHFREITDVQWSSFSLGGRWRLQGVVDAHVGQRFGAALYGALRDARVSGRGPDLHVDLAAVEFMDFACAQILMLHARSASRTQQVVLHGATDPLRHLIIAAGRPRTMIFDDETRP